MYWEELTAVTVISRLSSWGSSPSKTAEKSMSEMKLLLFGIWMDMGVIGIALAMVADWMIKAALIAARYRSKKWTKFQVI